MKLDVLIVDDSGTVRQMIKKILALSLPDLGETYEASDGLGALAMMAKHKVDLVLADINMPQMNGLELVNRMKKDPSLKGIPVIVISTEGSRERMDELDQRGVLAFLRKPFRPEQLKEAIYRIMELSDDSHSEESVRCDF